MKKVLLAAAVAAATIAGVLALRSAGPEDGIAPGPSPAREGTVTVTRRLAPDAVLSIKPGAPSTARAAAQTPPRISALLQEYYTGTNLKATYARLKDAAPRSAEESYVLAEILDRCARVTDRKAQYRVSSGNREEDRKRFVASVSPKDPNAAQRIAAHDRINSGRCDGLEGLETTEAEIRDLLRQAAADPKARARLVEKEIAATLPADGMPMMAADGTSRLPSISDAQIEALKQAVQSGDPQALSIAGRVFSSTMQNLVLRAGPGEQPVDIRAFYDAWILAACDLGQPCGAESSRLMHACAMQGNCGAQDMREHLFYFEHSPQQSQRLNEYHTQILQAARTGDWSYFTFQRSAPPRGSMWFYMAR